MAVIAQQEPNQQHELLDTEPVPLQPRGPVSAGSELRERWHLRTNRMRKGILEMCRISPSPRAEPKPTAQPIDSLPNNHIGRPVGEPTEQVPPETDPAVATEASHPTEQQNACDHADQHEQLNERERILRVRDEEEEVFEADILQDWLHHYVGDFLSRNNRTNDEPKFWLCLKAHEVNAHHHERSQYIAVNLLNENIRRKGGLARQLMRPEFSRNRQSFEIKVFDVFGFELKGDEQYTGFSASDDRHLMQISLSGTTLCGAQITLASSHLEPGTKPLVWTCGGLISFTDRIYALTVSHPLLSCLLKSQETMQRMDGPQKYGPDQTLGMESQRSVQRMNDPQEYRSNQDLSGCGWEDFGRTALHGISDSRYGANNNDWMLIEVKKHMQLPNVHLYNKSAKFDMGVDAASQDAYHVEGACQLLTSHGTMHGTMLRGSSYLAFGYTKLRTMQILIEKPLAQGDSGSWVVSEDSNVIGVVVAGADGAFDAKHRPIAFVLRMTDIYAALERVVPQAKPRILSGTENAILHHRRTYPEDDNLPGMWSLYTADIVNRFHESIGEIDPGHLIAEYMPSRMLDLRPFLMLGQVFPCDEHTYERLRAAKLLRWRLRGKGISNRAIEIWNQLHASKQGKNFVILLICLVQAGHEVMLDPPSIGNATEARQSEPRRTAVGRLMAYDKYKMLQFVGKAPVFSSWLTVLRGENAMVTEVINALILYSNLPESKRPGPGLVSDLVRLAAITPPLFRRYQWRQPIFTRGLPPADIACLLAKAYYAERNGCFFVYEGPFASRISSFLTVACRDRQISALDGKISTYYAAGFGMLHRRLRATPNESATAPRLFIGEGNGKDLPTTGRLIRRPELYEHLYTGVKHGYADTHVAGSFSTLARDVRSSDGGRAWERWDATYPLILT